MKNHRRHLGPGYTMYPAKWIREYLGDKLFKLIMWSVCSLLWGVIYYVMMVILNFVLAVFRSAETQMTAMELGMTGWGIAGYAVGCFGILIMVIRSRRGSKKTQRTTVRREDRLRRSVKK